MGFPGGSDDKESACNVGDLGLIPGLGGFPGRGHGNPLQYSCLEKPHRQRSLAGVAKSQTWLNTHTCTPTCITALFSMAKTWKWPKYPLRWMDKEDAIYKNIYMHNWLLLIHKKNEFLPFMITWMELVDVPWNKTETDKYCMISPTCEI